ncbi:PAS domain-containing protein [Seohaeicola zhoushanensis]|uniref:Aerotaxis receptor Aer n=1 Tax=Seohaeicola zhoushanensis TaxID=1569283 RepID=A0A8J3H2Y4_9RHOB|nr:PAS domain-containing protein [Seohaeicola zhoushanensis]GHF70449.1 aerotaxis receptor Aer [Seohaeicola zhoushanensis]
MIDEPVEGFGIEELFLSRTDGRGVILSGNSVFARLAGYGWAELIGAPHRLIRHPDMPRGVFHLLWETLKQGRSFGGYVKNRASDGRYYWVFAVVVPVQGGYLSVRLKPSTGLLAKVSDLYRAQLVAEAAGQTPAESAAAIVAAVQGLGHWDYRAFMGHALGAEFAARDAAMGRPGNAGVSRFDEIGSLLSQLMREVALVQDSFALIANSPANLIILGARLKSAREPMKVVAQNYGLLADELLRSITELAEGLEVLLRTAHDGRMGLCASFLYREAIQQYCACETDHGAASHDAEVEILTGALDRFLRNAVDGVQRIGAEVGRFVHLATQLRRQVSGLAVTRVTCRIEAAAIREDTSGIDEVAVQLAIFQQQLERALDRIYLACHGLNGRVEGLSAA